MYVCIWYAHTRTDRALLLDHLKSCGAKEDMTSYARVYLKGRATKMERKQDAAARNQARRKHSKKVVRDHSQELVPMTYVSGYVYRSSLFFTK